jgi:hypothetical protein
MFETTYRWTVTSEPRADFTAMVSLSTRDTGKPLPTRVRLSDEELVNDHVNVLLVEDDPSYLEMTELMVTQRDDRFGFTTATSAAGGLEQLEANRIDCVVSDCVEKSKGTKQCDILRTRILKAVR